MAASTLTLCQSNHTEKYQMDEKVKTSEWSSQPSSIALVKVQFL